MVEALKNGRSNARYATRGCADINASQKVQSPKNKKQEFNLAYTNEEDEAAQTQQSREPVHTHTKRQRASKTRFLPRFDMVFLSRPGHWPFTRLLLPHAMANTASSNVPVESCVIREKAQRAACAVPQTSTPCHWLGTTSLQIKRAQARHTRHLSISRLLETAGCGSRRSSIGLGDC